MTTSAAPLDVMKGDTPPLRRRVRCSADLQVRSAQRAQVLAIQTSVFTLSVY